MRSADALVNNIFFVSWNILMVLFMVYGFHCASPVLFLHGRNGFLDGRKLYGYQVVQHQVGFVSL